MKPTIKFSSATAVRMAADILLTSFSLLTAIVVRILLLGMQENDDQKIQEAIRNNATAYLYVLPILLAISVTVYKLSGFYNYGRHYQSKYKVLVILQAVSMSYLIFGTVVYLTWDRLPVTSIARGVFLLGWAFTLLFTLSVRMSTVIWEKVIHPDRKSRVRVISSAQDSVLVIGGAGYIGSGLVRKLLESGRRVRVMDMLMFGTDPIKDLLEHPRLELMQGDFRNVESTVKAMQSMGAVAHLGAIVGDPACELDHDVTISTNLSATKMIAEIAKASGVPRFVFASTCSVYGASDEILDERSTTAPVSLYGHTKLAAEKGLLSMSNSDFSPTILRFATIYGLSGRTRFDLVVNLLSAMAKIDGRITINGGGQWRPFLHVDDASLAVLTALDAPLSIVGNQIFNVGSDAQNYTIDQVGRLIEQYVPGAEVIFDPNSPDKRNYRVSFSKIERQLDFRPNWTLEMGIQQVVEAVASGEIKDYRDSKFSNVRFLTEAGLIDTIRPNQHDWLGSLPGRAAAVAGIAAGHSK